MKRGPKPKTARNQKIVELFDNAADKNAAIDAIANEFYLTPGTVYGVIRAAGRRLGYHKGSQTPDRDQEIIRLCLEGKTLQEVGDIYGVSRERIRQIVKRAGTHRAQRGISLKTSARRVEERQELIQKIKSRYGLPLAQYERLIKEDHALFMRQVALLRSKLSNARKQYPERPRAILFGEIDWPRHCPVTGEVINYFSRTMQDCSPAFYLRDDGKGYVPGNVVVMSLAGCRALMVAEERWGLLAARKRGNL